MLPLAQLSHRDDVASLWGQVRPRSGPQPYLLQRSDGVRWRPVGGVAVTGARGFLTREVYAPRGAKFRIWSLLDGRFSPTLAIR